MTKQELKKLIKEAIREELKEILVEAVEIASRPGMQLEHQTASTRNKPAEKPSQALDPISRILEETRRGMTREEYRQVMQTETGPSLSTPKPMPTGTRPEDIGSIDLSMIPGIGRAAQILKAAEEKDKERHS